MSCGTTVTILDPLSTRRSVSSFWPPPDAKAACSPVGSKVISTPPFKALGSLNSIGIQVIKPIEQLEPVQEFWTARG